MEILKAKALLTPTEAGLLNSFTGCMIKAAGILYIYLYGSRAAMISNEISDIDVAVIVEDEKIKELQEKLEAWIFANNITEIQFHPIIVGLKAFSLTRFGENIKKGVMLWKVK